MKGTLVGVGVGPGDPELLTLKAMKRMEQCDVLVVPDADKGESTAYKIALQAYPELAQKPTVTVRMPMTHDMAQWRASHRAAADQIEKQLDAGKMVVFLTLGDPTVYATYIYVHKMVESDGYPTEIVSGIPSFCAAVPTRTGEGRQFFFFAYRLLERRQMCIFSASAISSSRNWGWAMEIRPSARSQEDLPLTLNLPYSVTT